MAKITFIGAGSTVFAKNLMGDILSFPELANCTLTLFDINPERLNTSEIVAHHIAKKSNAHPIIETTMDRRAALDGADYAINMIQVGGYKPGTLVDFEIPKKYGLRQTIADTLGIGGIMRGLRTIPVMLDMCADMEDVCPDVVFLNYTNPMAILTWAMNRATKIKTYGLCHSVQGTAEQLAKDINVPIEEINYFCAGINHMAFYLKFERNGEDLYPLIHRVADEGSAPFWNLVRYDAFKRLGYFITESSEHFSEYTPWFIKRDRPELIEKYNIPLDEYIRRCENQIAEWEKLRVGLEAGEDVFEVTQSKEYAPLMIHSMETGIQRVVNANVPNNGLIDNLPQGCCVEVPCVVDKNGITPVKVGMLPPQLAAVIQTNINVQSLTVEAALTKKREHIYQAAMMDPHTGAELSLDQIWSLVDDLIEAHGDWLPEYH